MPNNIEEITQLRSVVGNESLPDNQRKNAAVHLVQLIRAAIPVLTEDDAEVAKLRKVYCDPSSDSDVFSTRKIWNEKMGWSANDGPTVSQARTHVHDIHRTRAVLGVITDESAHQLERLAACRWILETNPGVSKWRYNAYGPERLLAEVLPSSATKMMHAFTPAVPVARPPKSFADVWSL